MSLASDVRRDLGTRPRRLEPMYLYDALGSHLFDAICHLPWYRITRAESHLLSRFAGAMLAPLERPVAVVELGSGSGEKLSLVVEALRGLGHRPDVHVIDVSATALARSVTRVGQTPYVSVHGHHATYEVGLVDATRTRSARGSLLVLFLGSNIGNFQPKEALAFLMRVRKTLRPGDMLLLGTDLVKPEDQLLAAYDDPLGVTAAFNKNVLLRLNRELGADFDVSAFDHEGRWNAPRKRIEMHLVSRRRQRVRIPAARLSFVLTRGETIWTESSYKYTAPGVARQAALAGFTCREQWIDPEALYAVTLCSAA
jgi:L-histidine N-alpha-methyltransferase